ncbi:uncharacterized protein LOC130981258 [Arachis stenosperma]|uniref:uncharacterized protein LOC130981258 n=1 Tax=Arachis stenosperma TaxID=217475 RepID=UPI0025AC06C0|nr:uncharacterized protein LOC130981258 [Arachis stenosperma]
MYFVYSINEIRQVDAKHVYLVYRVNEIHSKIQNPKSQASLQHQNTYSPCVQLPCQNTQTISHSHLFFLNPLRTFLSSLHHIDAAALECDAVAAALLRPIAASPCSSASLSSTSLLCSPSCSSVAVPPQLHPSLLDSLSIITIEIGDLCSNHGVKMFTEELNNFSGNGSWDSWFLPLTEQTNIVCEKMIRIPSVLCKTH